MNQKNGFSLCFLVLILIGEGSTETIPLLIHRYHSLSLIQVDTEHKNVSSSKTIVSGIEEPPISIAIDPRQNLGVYIDTVSKASEDYFQIFSISNSSNFRRFSRYVGVAEDSITSLAYDWVTKKLYLAIETTGIRNLGRIEACPLDGTPCAVLLQNELDTIHSLVVDPINGYMYWLNKLQKRIERAWLNGRHLDRHPFHEDLPPENISVTTGLTLDIPSRRLYFIRTRIHNTLSEIVSCDFYNRTSCKVVIDNIRAYHMNVYGEYLFWTSIDGNHEGVRFCQKDNCRKSVGVIVNTSSVDVFRVFHEDVQPERSNPNPCAINNGDCSHLCLLTPGVPWRSCSCPVGIKLLQDDLTCEPKGVEKALLVAAASGLFYISLDTDDYIPQPITYPGYDRESSTMQKIVDVEYDPVEEMVYWMDAELKRIRRARLNGTGFEDFITTDLNKTISSLSIDPISRNLFWIDQTFNRIEVARLNQPNSYRRTIFSSANPIKALTIEYLKGHLYFAIKTEEETTIEKAQMDGNNRETIVKLPSKNLLTDILVDADGEMLYWSEAQESKIMGISLKEPSKVEVIAKELINPNSISKLSSTIFCNSYQGRTLTAIRLPPSNGVSTPVQSTPAPQYSRREISDSVIYGQTALKAVYLHSNPMDKEVVEKNSCAKDNGGCEHICIPIPLNDPKCLCSIGYELTTSRKKCVRPQSFLIYSQQAILDDLMRISIKKFPSNVQRMTIPNITATPHILTVDPTKGMVYWVVEHQMRHDKGYSVVRRAHLNGTGSELVVESKTLRMVEGIAVDWISGSVYMSNGYLKRIEVCSPISSSCKTILWKKINPKHLAIHPNLKKIFFTDHHKHGVNLVVSSINGLNGTAEVLVYDVGEVQGIAIDVKHNKIYWSAHDGKIGTISVVSTEGTSREQLKSETYLHPTSLTTLDSKLYFANRATNAIETLELNRYDDEIRYGVLHENVPKIQSLAAAYVTELEEFNPCGFSNFNPKQCICLPTSSINAECGCPDQYEYDSNLERCLPPKRFLLVASKDRIIRYKIKQNHAMDHVFDEDPYVILPITNLGLPTSLAFDSLSSKRYFYWIDAQDGPSGTIKRASDTVKANAKPLFLGLESNCSQIFDIVLDELGRQLFVSCTQRDLDFVGFVHVWKICQDDNLRYVGRVISGDKKSIATDSYPSPKQIAVFNRLDALFYVDHSRVREAPVIVRCKLNGKDCETVVSQGLSFSGVKLYADLTNSRLIYTSNTGVWSRDVYVDHDVKRHLISSPNRNVQVTPVDERVMLVVTSYDMSFGSGMRHEDKILDLPYNISSQTISTLKSVLWAAPPEIMRRISSLSIVGTSGFDSANPRGGIHFGPKDSIESACIRSDCSHMCRIPYDTASLQKNHECLCPNDYRKDDEAPNQCIKNIPCARWQFSCENGKECIHMGYKCDGVKDCSDNSDESYATCGVRGSFSDVVHITDGSRWSFQNWTCDDRVTSIPKHLFCNGHWDCEDGSDEQYCQCLNPANYFDCTVWKKSDDLYYDYSEEEDCISRGNLCDGVPQCKNKIDEEEKLCTMLAMTPNTSLMSLFDFRTWTGYAIVLVFVLLALVIIIPLCCCCFMHRSPNDSERYGANTSTLLSTHQTMLSTTSPPTHAEARVLLPQGAQVELSMRTYGPQASTSDGYNTLPLRSHYSSQPYSQHHHQQVVFHDGMRTNRSYVTAMDRHGMYPFPGVTYDVYQRFHAPPPSAASLSTYGIVKPAEMRMMQTPRSSQERRTMPRKMRRNNSQHSRQTYEIEQREYLIDFFPPPSYSEVGSAVKCSTPLSMYRRYHQRRNFSIDMPSTSRHQPLPIDATDSETTSSDATREVLKHLVRRPPEKAIVAPTNSRNPSSEESMTKVGVGGSSNKVQEGRKDETISASLPETSTSPELVLETQSSAPVSESFEPSSSGISASYEPSSSGLTKITEESSNAIRNLTRSTPNETKS